MSENLPTDSEENAAATSSAPKREYSHNHKIWIVCRRLEMQQLFDNKLHTNSQKWEDLCNEFRATFPEQSFRKNSSIVEQWNKQQAGFREFCKTEAAFRAGRTSGLGRDQQETALNAKRVLCHSIFVEFDQGERPMSMPPTLLNGGNALQHSATEVAECNTLNPEEEPQTVQESQPPEGAKVAEPKVAEPTDRELSVPQSAESGSDNQLSPDARTIAALGETPLSRSTRIGGVSRTPGSGSESESSQKHTLKRGRGRPSSVERFLEMLAEDKRLKAEASSNMDNFMTMFMLMQRERMAAEDERAQKEAERARKESEQQQRRDMQFMTLMTALLSPHSAASAAAAASSASFTTTME